MAMFGDHGDRRTKRASAPSTFELSVSLYPPAWPARTVTQSAFSLILYCTSAVGGQLAPTGCFAGICDNTFCQALFHYNYRYGAELHTMDSAGGNYSACT